MTRSSRTRDRLGRDCTTSLRGTCLAEEIGGTRREETSGTAQADVRIPGEGPLAPPSFRLSGTTVPLHGSGAHKLRPSQGKCHGPSRPAPVVAASRRLIPGKSVGRPDTTWSGGQHQRLALLKRRATSLGLGQTQRDAALVNRRPSPVFRHFSSAALESMVRVGADLSRVGGRQRSDVVDTIREGLSCTSR